MTIFNILIPLTVSDGYYIKIRLKPPDRLALADAASRFSHR
jgi:hypothetical protein